MPLIDIRRGQTPPVHVALLAGVMLAVWVHGGCMAAAAAENSDFLVASWHTENGLPDGNVTALAQTRDGYLWVGTFKGLARFDGVRFTVFGAEPGLELLGERVAALAMDGRGRLWVGGDSGALAFLEQGRFQAVEPLSAATGETNRLVAGEERKTTSSSTHSRQLSPLGLVEDGDGAMWFQTRAMGLLRVKDGRAQRWTQTNGLPSGRIFALAADGLGQPWLLAGDSLYRWTAGLWLKQMDNPGLGEMQPVLSPSRAGGLWVGGPRGTWGNGGRVVHVFDNRHWEELRPTPLAQDSPRSQVTALLQDRTGRIWLGMHWAGMFVSDKDGDWQRLRSEGPLAQCRINCLFEDRQGCVWVGTLGDGLYRLTRRVVSVVHLPEPSRGHLINTVSAGIDGSVWIGTDGAGLFQFDNGNFVHFGLEEGLGSTLIYSALADRETNVWCGTSAGLFHLETNRFRPVRGFPVPSSPILALFQDRTGRLWAGTSQGPVSLQDGHFMLHRLDSAPGAVEIRCFAEGRDGELWVATVGRGLFCLKSNRVDHYGPVEGFSSPDARSVWCGADGNVWAGTLGAGLFHLREGRFQALSAADGLPDETINSLIEDQDSTLWAASYNGLFGCSRTLLARYGPGQTPPLVWRWLSLADGLDFRTCSGSGQPVSSVDAQGRIWFVNQRSVGVLERRLLPQDGAGQLLIEEVTVDGAVQAITNGAALRVSSGMKRIDFHYTCPDLAAPATPRFRYRLQGLEKDWFEAGARRTAYYGGLPPGHYEFEVMFAGPDGAWREPASHLPMEIVPRLWERRSLQAATALALLCGVSSVIWATARARLRRRLATLERQQALAHERARIARDMHDELGAGLTQISLLSAMADSDENGAGNHKIAELSRDLVRSLDEIVWVVRPQNDNLESLIEYLGQASRDLCEHSPVRCWFSGPARVPFLEVPANLRHNLLLACREALNNVLKHSGAGEVRVRVLFDSGVLSVEIADNGQGFELAKGEAKRSGLLHMRQRMHEAGGTCEVETAAGEGSRVRFVLSLGVPTLGNVRT